MGVSCLRRGELLRTSTPSKNETHLHRVDEKVQYIFSCACSSTPPQCAITIAIDAVPNNDPNSNDRSNRHLCASMLARSLVLTLSVLKLVWKTRQSHDGRLEVFSLTDETLPRVLVPRKTALHQWCDKSKTHHSSMRLVCFLICLQILLNCFAVPCTIESSQKA